MVKFHLKSELPYTPFQLRDLVMDVESYPQFLPNCIAVDIVESVGDINEERLETQNSIVSLKTGKVIILADMAISYKGLIESYRSKVELSVNTPKKIEIHVDAISGPFKYLKNSWIINQYNKHSVIDFAIDFSFKSPILNTLMGSILKNTTSDMLLAFEARAKQMFEK